MGSSRVVATEGRVLAACLAMFTASCDGSAARTGEAVLAANAADALFIGDHSNTVERFDTTGALVDRFIIHAGGLMGPQGILFDRASQPARLLLANQDATNPHNGARPLPGEILEYSGLDGRLLDRLVPRSSPDTPFGPRGIVLGADGILYVADLGSFEKPSLGFPSTVKRYDRATGAVLDDLDLGELIGPPRGIVFGPDGKLYVSVTNLPEALGGRIVRFDTTSTRPVAEPFIDCKVVMGQSCGFDLNRPEGLVFGPDGRLYVTSFRSDPTDNDKILVFEGSGPSAGQFFGKIELDQPGEPRAFAQALLFGPNGDLFVPISGNGVDSGEVRRYLASTSFQTFVPFVPSAAQGGPLVGPLYLTFCNTDPATLVYEPQRGGCPTP